MEKRVTLLHCWWECELIQPLWKTVWRFLKKLGIKPPYDPEIPILGIYPEKNKKYFAPKWEHQKTRTATYYCINLCIESPSEYSKPRKKYVLERKK